MALKRPNRNIEIFSISALDLFASAMGAFILVAVILFPYYLKRQEVESEAQQIRTELRAAQEATRRAEQRADAASQEASSQQDATTRAQAAEARAKKAEARAAALEKQVATAKKALQAERNSKGSTVFALLGITTKAKSFVLLIDMSSSMQAYSSLMTNTVRRLLQPMEGDIRLTIIGFNAPFGSARLHPWTQEGKLVAMTPGGKQKAMNFVQKLSGQFAGKTPTHAALREALRYPVEAIILLSDGAPTDNDAAAIVSEITNANRGRMEINCVAIGDFNKAPRLVAFLQALARRNRGDFTGVSG
ncbi:MAG: VWA domain-containing protein [Alphaproteobacteria bacterium]|nr:VWA domain-containing protein [Alphaproteobacteria bacterium]